MATYDIECPDSDATEAFGERLGKQLRGGEVVELVGDIGSGKTTFVRGLARGLDSSEHVSSPTFVVSKTYQGRLILHHHDLYRLDKPGLISHQLSEILEEDPAAVIVIEWADSISDVLPDSRIVIRFKLKADEQRLLQTAIPQELEWIQC